MKNLILLFLLLIIHSNFVGAFQKVEIIKSMTTITAVTSKDYIYFPLGTNVLSVFYFYFSAENYELNSVEYCTLSEEPRTESVIESKCRFYSVSITPKKESGAKKEYYYDETISLDSRYLVVRYSGTIKGGNAKLQTKGSFDDFFNLFLGGALSLWAFIGIIFGGVVLISIIITIICCCCGYCKCCRCRCRRRKTYDNINYVVAQPILV